MQMALDCGVVLGDGHWDHDVTTLAPRRDFLTAELCSVIAAVTNRDHAVIRPCHRDRSTVDLRSLASEFLQLHSRAITAWSLHDHSSQLTIRACTFKLGGGLPAAGLALRTCELRPKWVQRRTCPQYVPPQL